MPAKRTLSSTSNAASQQPPAKKLHQATLSFGTKPAASASSDGTKTTAKEPTLTLSTAGPASSSPTKPHAPSVFTKSKVSPSLPYEGDVNENIEKLFPKLKEDQRALVKLEVESMGREWLDALKTVVGGQEFLKLKEFVLKEIQTQTVYPPAQDIYSFTRFSKLNDVKLVVIGQDPYHQPRQAHGLSFSVRKGIQVPPSLRNIYKEIKDEYPNFVVPSHGDLSSWAAQGVLLLNTSLTVRANTAGSHAKAGWEPFTKAIIKELAKRDPGKVFICWGKHAEKMVDASGVDQKKHLILRSAHPSPLSASRGFFGTGHFKLADEWLQERWGEGGGIDWTSVSQTNPVPPMVSEKSEPPPFRLPEKDLSPKE
ncbi:uracil-dna glycosylase [Phaffia rhodozyma]|uniref:Uracil-DNA glycosylase n=1 Tax=Phaffia rhodozyma TaxID=264483 RepID=A0A0F7SWY2_PHARH|nr:uracil-dna glycosylase [Phaffia rhodozyma]